MFGLRSNLFSTQSIIPYKNTSRISRLLTADDILHLFLEDYPAFKGLVTVNFRGDEATHDQSRAGRETEPGG